MCLCVFVCVSVCVAGGGCVQRDIVPMKPDEDNCSLNLREPWGLFSVPGAAASEPHSARPVEYLTSPSWCFLPGNLGIRQRFHNLPKSKLEMSCHGYHYCDHAVTAQKLSSGGIFVPGLETKTGRHSNLTPLSPFPFCSLIYILPELG